MFRYFVDLRIDEVALPWSALPATEDVDPKGHSRDFGR